MGKHLDKSCQPSPSSAAEGQLSSHGLSLSSELDSWKCQETLGVFSKIFHFEFLLYKIQPYYLISSHSKVVKKCQDLM